MKLSGYIELNNDIIYVWRNLNARFETRIVGGAVRDWVMGNKPKDIDFCTTATPDEMIQFAKEFNIRIEPTGLQHGTVSFILGSGVYEFTTLRVDEVCDGRHAEVKFTYNFQADAARRDFTFNAMSMNIEREIFDYFGGFEDAKNRRIKFVGETRGRIQEDYLRILRYFRFAARYDCVMSYEDMIIISEEAQGLKNISYERIWSEMSKLITSPYRSTPLLMMAMMGVFNAIGMNENWRAPYFFNYAKTPASFMAGFITKEEARDVWKMSYAEVRELCYVQDAHEFLVKTPNNKTRSQVIIEKILMGEDDIILLRRAIEAYGYENLSYLTDMEWPKFPLSGSDLIAEGYTPGPKLGQELYNRKVEWVKNLTQ